MNAKIINNKIGSAGRHGINISGVPNAVVEGNTVNHARYDAIRVAASPDAASFIERLGLPPETDARELAELIRRLQLTAPTGREEAAKKSGIFSRVKSGVLDATTIAANIVAISTQNEGFKFVKSVLGI